MSIYYYYYYIMIKVWNLHIHVKHLFVSFYFPWKNSPKTITADISFRFILLWFFFIFQSFDCLIFAAVMNIFVSVVVPNNRIHTLLTVIYESHCPRRLISQMISQLWFWMLEKFFLLMSWLSYLNSIYFLMDCHIHVIILKMVESRKRFVSYWAHKAILRVHGC